MALVNEGITYVSDGNMSGNLSSPETCVFEEQKGGMAGKTSSASAGSSSSVSSDQGLVFHQAADYHEYEVHNPLINFRGGYDHFQRGNGSLLNFEQSCTKIGGGYSTWEGDKSYGYDHWMNQVNPPRCSSNDPRLVEDVNCFETATSFGSITSGMTKDHGEWLYSLDTIHESRSPGQAQTGPKRPHMGEIMKAPKKQCTGKVNSISTTTSASAANEKNKPKASSTKDPQSLAAKNRRERISERLKILQELVPNGTKVDLVTMLEKAIGYVKFLQLQVKVLATDEFWPVQGGKAPDISQVKEAIDAILSSQKDRTSCSK